MLGVLCLILSGCLERFSKEEIEKQKNELKGKIAKMLPEKIDIFIFSFENTSKNEEIEYLKKAIPDLINQNLSTLEYENAYVPISYKDIKMPPDIIKLINNKNSYFFNYITNMKQTITQYTTNITNYVTNIEKSVHIYRRSMELEQKRLSPQKNPPSMY